MSLLAPSTLLRPLAVAALLALSAVAPAGAAEAPSDTTDEGLVPVKVKGVDKVWQRPGTPWAGYGKVLVAPVEVSFSKSWNPREYADMGLKPADVDRIRSTLAGMTRDTFAAVLGAGGYTVVQQPGEGVLEVRPDIVNLFVNAPDAMNASRSRSYVVDAGEMTLALELRDSVTGTLLARARDRRRGAEVGRMTWANSVFNRQEADRALEAWARQLKGALDAARAAPSAN